jgi:hypothetical protein
MPDLAHPYNRLLNREITVEEYEALREEHIKNQSGKI